MATKFPGQVDTFPTMLDITASDAELVKQYQAAMEASDYNTAQQALAAIPRGNRRLFQLVL